MTKTIINEFIILIKILNNLLTNKMWIDIKNKNYIKFLQWIIRIIYQNYTLWMLKYTKLQKIINNDIYY